MPNPVYQEYEDEVMSMASTECDEDMDEMEDLKSVDVIASTAGFKPVCLLNWINQGTKDYQRVGGEIWMNRISITPDLPNIDYHFNFRLAIVYDKQPVLPTQSGDYVTLPTWLDVFQNQYADGTTSNAIGLEAYEINRKNRDRFIVLYNKHYMGYQAWYNIAPTGYFPPTIIDLEIPLGLPTVYQEAAGGMPARPAVITTGALYYMVNSSEPSTGHARITGSNVRLYYEDV